MSSDNTKPHRQLMTIQIIKSKYSELKKLLQQIPGYKSNIIISNGGLNDEIEVLITFNNFNGTSRKLLENFLKRRNAKIVDSSKENNGFINPASKKIFWNTVLYFAITMSASVFSINPIAYATEMKISFMESMIYGTGPSIGAALTSVLVYYRR